MREVNIEIQEDIKDFIRSVSEASPQHDVYLVGGYLRDNYYSELQVRSRWGRSISPKDVDIVMVPKTEGVTVPVDTVKGCYVQYITPVTTDTDLYTRGLDKLIGIRRRELSTPDLQLIVYKKYLTEEEVIKDMDMNIVQVVWNPLTDVCTGSEAFIKGHSDKVIECLHEYDTERTYFRYERMEKKLKDYSTVGKPDLTFTKKEKKMRSPGASNSADIYED